MKTETHFRSRVGFWAVVIAAGSRSVLALLLSLLAVISTPAATVDFARDVRPILSDKCYHCHGPDEKGRKAKLRLDTKEGVFRSKDGVAVVVPGKSAKSELIKRISSHDPDEVMPPPEAKLGRLKPAEINLLKQWIDQGAPYQSHWSFQSLAPVTLPPVPKKLPSGVRSQGAIDRLVFSGLAARKLSPQLEADRATLIRRVSFDLTGLPPTPAEVDAFVKETDAQSYERLVDRLLKSPRYGERMAADWLDLARYADSYGFQVDRERDMWPWRDWVVKAFNENLSWDKFVTWQLAGDLLPGATDEQVLATAFNRLHPQESEGGSVEEEYRVNYINDRVTTFGTAFLGLTLECCRCHDHKFDPLTRKEYYQLFAFFDDIDEAGLYSYFTLAAPTPSLWLLSDTQKREFADATSAVKSEEAKLAVIREQRRPAFAEWLAHRPAAPVTLRDEVARFTFDGRNPAGSFISSISTNHTATSPLENELVAGMTGKAIKLTGDHAVTTTLGNFHRQEPFSVSLWLQTPEVKARAVVMHRSRAWTDAASRGYELLIEEGRLKWSLIYFWPGDAISIRATDPLPVNEWVQVTVTSDGSSRAEGLRLFVNGRAARTEVIRDHLTKDITGGGGDTIALGERFRDQGFKGGLVDDLRVFGRALGEVEAQEVFRAGTLAALLAKDAGALTAVEREGLFQYYLIDRDEPFREQLAALKHAREAQGKIAETANEIMVMRELPQPKTAYMLKRGEYNQREQAVEPGTPAALPPFPAGQPSNRLGLARWLTDARHPLLARVTVNRFWQACFGRGLVKTAEDLGSQADRPDYPELLDWLAGEFIRSGWDVKALMKTIVMSHTYRQRSFASPHLLTEDPENAWLASGPHHRLPAEMIRDNVLAASGLLVEKLGGPPVRSYDMPESFKPSAAGKGDELYRRSLYTFWRRTGPAPVLEAFDLPKRVVCVARRDTTSSPLHAFVLLNGPQFVEAARVLGEKLHRDCGGRRDEIVAQAFLRLTSRRPDASERKILERMYDEQLNWFRQHPEQGTEYIGIGDTKRDATFPAPEIAAAATVVNALMNYDGSVVKR